MMMQGFYVQNMTTGNEPRVRHDTYRKAADEAVRLSKENPGQEFYVFSVEFQAAFKERGFSSIDVVVGSKVKIKTSHTDEEVVVVTHSFDTISRSADKAKQVTTIMQGADGTNYSKVFSKADWEATKVPPKFKVGERWEAGNLVFKILEVGEDEIRATTIPDHSIPTGYRGMGFEISRTNSWEKIS